VKGRANKDNKLETARKAQIIKGQTTCKMRKWSAKPKQGERHAKTVLTRKTDKADKIKTKIARKSTKRGKTLTAGQTTYEIKMARKAHMKRGER